MHVHFLREVRVQEKKTAGIKLQEYFFIISKDYRNFKTMARKFHFHYLFIMFEMAVLFMSEQENKCFVLLKIDLIIITTSKSIFFKL